MPRRHRPEVVELTAEPVRSLDQSDLVAACGCHPSRLEFGRATPDDQHLAGRRRPILRRIGPGPFQARLRVHEAAHRHVLLEHAGAALVAGDAGADVVRPALDRLPDDRRFGDVGPRHPHEVGPPGGDHRLGLRQRPEAADREDGQLVARAPQRAADAGRQMPEHGRIEAHVGHLRRERVARVVGRVGHVHEVELHGVRDAGDDLLDFGEVEPRLDELLRAHPDSDRAVRPDRLPDGRDHSERKAHPILERAAELVLPCIGQRRQKLLQQVAVADLDLDPVEPGLGDVQGRRGMCRDYALHLFRGHGVRHGRRGGPAHGGRPPGDRALEIAVHLPSEMNYLAEELGALGADRLRDAGETGDAAAVEAGDGLRPAQAVLLDADRLEDDRTDTAAGACPVILEVALGREVILPEIGRVRRHEDAVAQCEGADRHGREHVRVGVYSARTRHFGRHDQRDPLARARRLSPDRADVISARQVSSRA